MSFQVDDGRIASLDGQEIADTIIRARNATQGVSDDLDALIQGYGPKLYCWRDSAKSVNDVTWYAIEFDAEDYDTAGFHDVTTNPTDIIIPQDGRYLMAAQTEWDTGSNGVRYMVIEVNDGGTKGNGVEVLREYRAPLAGSGTTTVSAAAIRNFYRGDVLHVWVYQNSGGAKALNINSETPAAANFFVISRLGDIQD